MGIIIYYELKIIQQLSFCYMTFSAMCSYRMCVGVCCHDGHKLVLSFIYPNENVGLVYMGDFVRPSFHSWSDDSY